MSELLFLLVIAMAVALFRLTRRVAALEIRLADVETDPHHAVPPPPSHRVDLPVPGMAEPHHPMPAPPPPAAEPPPPAPPPVPRRERQRIDIETLVGTRLPIWIGGLALVVAGIFLVRLSIEAGWLTPAVRTVLAAVFAALLLGAGEAARRLPATRGDPRVGQVLAGAGIASAYATLYLAAAAYHLVGPLAGFVTMLAVTALGLFLALRHGPPTAVMALIGGFAAPMVAGYDAGGIGPLLVYLALFVAALLALAGARGWTWLAVAALGAGFGWSALLIALLPPDDLGGVGGFVVALAVGGALAAPRAAVEHRALRVAPVLIALVQLLALAPALDFSPLAWGFYLVLSAAALFLAWRDRALLPGAIAAAILVTLLVAAGLARDSTTTTAALPVAIALFAGAGGLWSRRSDGWATVALTGGAGPLLAAQLVASGLLPASGWIAAHLALAVAGAALGWHHRDRAGRGDMGLVGGIAVTALGLALAVGNLVPPAFVALAPLAALAVVAAAMPYDERALGRLAILPGGVLLILAVDPLSGVAHALLESLAFEALPFAKLPSSIDAATLLLAPALLVLTAARWRTGLFEPARRAAAIVATVIGILGTYVLLKHILAIDALPRFVALGFIERAILTDIALLAGLALWRHQPPVSRALVALGLARIAWYDLLGLNPVWITQAVGPLPVANAAVLHLALAAAILWHLHGLPRRAWIAATLTLCAVLALIRQATHGTFLTGPVGTGENWGYSAAMLALAIVWLWRGVARGSADLRRFGLTLLTLTTLKVFLIDAAALGGIWRIVSFLGLGVALIAIGWGYRRFLTAAGNAPPAGPAPA